MVLWEEIGEIFNRLSSSSTEKSAPGGSAEIQPLIDARFDDIAWGLYYLDRAEYELPTEPKPSRVTPQMLEAITGMDGAAVEKQVLAEQTSEKAQVTKEKEPQNAKTSQELDVAAAQAALNASHPLSIRDINIDEELANV